VIGAVVRAPPDPVAASLAEPAYRCALSTALAERLDVSTGRHLRVESKRTRAFVVVHEIYRDERPTLALAEPGRERLRVHERSPVSVSGLVPREDVMTARRVGGFAETVWDAGDPDRLLVSACHGGDVEFGTVDAAVRVFRGLRDAGLPCTLWACQGFQPDAFDRWHVPEPCLSPDSYPGLSRLVDRRFEHAVSIHMQNADHVGVGGRVDDDVRHAAGKALRARLPDSKRVVTDLDEMQLTGRSRTNSVNYLSRHGGLHLELTPVTCYRYRKRVARAILDVLADT
jgi:phage replication-related protein YjqB (UPF0714/DUF867 family)